MSEHLKPRRPGEAESKEFLGNSIGAEAPASVVFPVSLLLYLWVCFHDAFIFKF